ncbi:flavodoxin family protein [Candidatus Solincola sp.]|jgi:flavodoxin|nr:flavodoxin domain-containing protein [Actinomycetota bacterium]MDI7252829.1 flavodoxin domain-containing protein [Actinomycetota bacterium]
MFGKSKKALIIYHTKTGHTGEAAEAVARGLEAGKVTVTVKPVSEARPDELEEYSILAVGSPTRGARPARVVKKFIKGLDRKALKGKKATVFSAYAGFRGKATLRRLRRLLRRRGAKVVLRGVAVKAGAPLSLWKGPQVSPEDVARLEELGRSLARKA